MLGHAPIGAQRVTGQPAVIVAAGIGSAESVGAPTVAVRITGAGVASESAVGRPAISVVVLPLGVAGEAAVGRPAVTATIEASGVAGESAVGRPTVVPAGSGPALPIFRPPRSVRIRSVGLSANGRALARVWAAREAVRELAASGATAARVTLSRERIAHARGLGASRFDVRLRAEATPVFNDLELVALAAWAQQRWH